MHIYLKVLAGVGIAGTIGGGAYAISTLTSSSNEIADKLIKEGYTILTNKPESNKHWTAILANYKTLAESNTKLKFGSFTGKETNPKPEEELARLCQELLKPNTSLDTKDQDNYKKAEKWCVVPVTVSDILKTKGYVALNTGTGDDDKVEWENKIKAIKAEENLSIDGLSLEKDKKTEASEKEITSIKQKCQDTQGKKNHEDRYEDNLNLFSNWCSNKVPKN